MTSWTSSPGTCRFLSSVAACCACSAGTRRFARRLAKRPLRSPGAASGRVLVVAGPHLDPFLFRQLASGRTDVGELLEILLAGRAGREQDEHPGRRTALVGEGVDPALRDVEEVALHRVDPGLPVEEPDGALHDVEGLGEGLVEMRVGAPARPGHVPLEQAILTVGRRARGGEHDVRTRRVCYRRHLAAWTVTRADLTDVF